MKYPKRLSLSELKDIRPQKIILDTNIWISFLISNDFNALDKLIRNKQIQLVFSEELIGEFLTVVRKPKFAKYFNPQDVGQLLDLFELYGKLITVTSNFLICRDPKDDFLLNLAYDGDVSFLVTGDDDLLFIKEFHRTKIITISELIRRFS